MAVAQQVRVAAIIFAKKVENFFYFLYTISKTARIINRGGRGQERTKFRIKRFIWDCT